VLNYYFEGLNIFTNLIQTIFGGVLKCDSQSGRSVKWH